MSDTEWGILFLGGAALLLFMGTRRGSAVLPAGPPVVTTNNDLAVGAQAVGGALQQAGGIFQAYFGSAMAADQAAYDGVG